MMCSCDTTPTPLCSVFVSGLGPTTSIEALKVHCTQFGQVEKAIVLNGNSSDGAAVSLCCGVVQFSSLDEAAQAARSLTSSTLEGSVLQCHIVGSVADQDKLTINEPLPGLARVLHPKKVFVGGLPKEITIEEVTSLFSEAGIVVSAEVLADKKGRVLGFAEVEFSDPESAQAAIAKLNGFGMILKAHVLTRIIWQFKYARFQCFCTLFKPSYTLFNPRKLTINGQRSQ